MDEHELMSALEKKALGFEFDEVVEEFSQDENGQPVLSKRKVTKKFNPPDITALKFLLEQNESSQYDFSQMTDKQLVEEKERLLKLLLKKENCDEDGNL